MKATVRTKNDNEYVGGDVSLMHGFVRIENAKQRELITERVKTGAHPLLVILFMKNQYDYRNKWILVKKKASIILPESQILWIEEDGNGE